MVITEGYQRMPKDTERYRKLYRRLPKAGLKIEYRLSVSGVVANLELGDAWGSGTEPEPPAGSRAGRGVRGRSPLKLKAFLFLNIPS